MIKAGEGGIRVGQNFQCRPKLILKYKNNIKMNLNLVVLIQEINYLK